MRILSKMRAVGILVLGLGILQACAVPFGPNGSPAAATNSGLSADPQLQQQAVGVLQQRCATCHGAGQQVGGVYGITDPASLIAQHLLVPGQSSSSLLVSVLESGAMPPSGRLNASEVDVVKNWIDSYQSVAPSPTPVPTATPQPKPTPVHPKPTPPQPKPTPGLPGSASFTVIRATILNRCTSCHGSFGSYRSLMASGVVRAGSSAQSALYARVANQSMPPRGSNKLNLTELSLVKTWIDSGALNN